MQRFRAEGQRFEAVSVAEFVRILVSHPASEVLRLPLPKRPAAFRHRNPSKRCAEPEIAQLQNLRLEAKQGPAQSLSNARTKSASLPALSEVTVLFHRQKDV